MAFYYPTDPHEEDCGNECYSCRNTKEDLDMAGENLLLLLKHLYKPDGFDNEEFEDNLKDLCKRLEVNFPKKDLQITRKK